MSATYRNINILTQAMLLSISINRYQNDNSQISLRRRFFSFILFPCRNIPICFTFAIFTMNGRLQQAHLRWGAQQRSLLKECETILQPPPSRLVLFSPPPLSLILTFKGSHFTSLIHSEKRPSREVNVLSANIFRCRHYPFNKSG